MINKINKIFNFYQESLNVYAKKQEIISSNIANADTPGYKSIDIDFAQELKKRLSMPKKTTLSLKKTSCNHFNLKNYNVILPWKTQMVFNNHDIKPNGNTVNMDRERVEFVKNSLKYQSNLEFVKNEIKNIIQVLQG